jgi:hypothetical protein
MDRDTSQPLTTEQAKDRLRAAAEHASPAEWLHRHPWGTVGLAVVGGFVISRMRLPRATSALTIQWLGPLLMGAAIRQLTSPGSSSRKTPLPRHGSK